MKTGVQGGPRVEADLGWDSFFGSQVQSLGMNVDRGRVAVAHREHYLLLTPGGAVQASLSGRLRHEAQSSLDMPTVGDWVGFQCAQDDADARIVHLFTRKTSFVRQAAGRPTEPQVLAANVDHVAVVTSPNRDFNPSRIERYLLAIRDSGARALVVLNKVDVCDDPRPFIEAIVRVAVGAEVVCTAAKLGTGLDEVRKAVRRGQTLAFVGSSGVGKSTIVNRLIGEEIQRTGELSERADRGQHVTTHRELFVLDDGILLLDTPGMRELQLWSSEEPAQSFGDIEALAAQCRFRDCSHAAEPGCAVRQALANDTLPAWRLASYQRYRVEMAEHKGRQDVAAQLAQRREVRVAHRSMRKAPKRR